ncbi:MAG: LysM peptidoglycan-binding domain-containing protein [Anaerolineae bacterium]|nr:LysM peptidoglycan-binding domain-containing protein [Anaerolineae bacterium]
MKRKRAAEQQCPICGAAYPLEASRCAECGAALRGVAVPILPPAPVEEATPRREKPTARPKGTDPTLPDWALGDADLDEGLLPHTPMRGLFIGCALATVIIVLALFLVSRPGGAPMPGAETGTPTASGAPPAIGMDGSAAPGFDTLTPVMPPPTNTRIVVMPTMAFDTVTPMPATLTPTPTRGPCIQVAAQGDTLYGLAARCGYRDMAIIPQILSINNMQSAAELQIGQSVEIPWPDQAASGDAAAAPGDATIDPALATSDPMNLEPTLPPGVTWYTVRAGDTALSIVLELDINMRILRDLNPEMSFDTCDFGQVGGGPSCNVMVFEGQRVRVPAPTPTATAPPTLTGSETPMPTPTPTYNAPFAVSPSDNMLFEAFELPTLRWVASGALREDEVYLITVDDRTGGVLYYVTTRDLSFQAPADWQPTDGRRHVFAWNVAVARLQPGTNTAAPTAFKTETRTFTWVSR